MIQKDKCLTYIAATELLKQYYENEFPITISKLVKEFKKHSLGICALAEAFHYLKYLMLDTTTIPILEIHEYFHDNENLDDAFSS